MRVLVATDRIGALPSPDAGAAIGRAFRDARAQVQVAVVPLAAGGIDLALALSALNDPAIVITTGDPPADLGLDLTASSVEVGRRLADALSDRPPRVVVDLSGLVSLDGGAGILAALGAEADVPLDQGVSGLEGLTRMELAPVRERLGDTELIGVVDSSEIADMLLGLRGLVVRRGHAVGAAPTDLLPADSALGALAGALGMIDGPGLGAGGGTALALRALGAVVTSGPALCAHVAGLDRTAAVADVLVTGTDALDFADRGGPVVTEMAGLAERVLTPCIALARDVQISARELRTHGLEVAYALGGDAQLTPAELTARAAGPAQSWTW
ncbi:MAG: glycerate kinase [Propioniciclava sp.]